MNLEVLAFALILCSSISSGAFAVPLKLRQRYEWENTWFVGFVFALLIIPFIAVNIFLPQWFQAVRATGLNTVLLAMVFGFLWGLGTVTLAIGITTIGLSMGYTIIHGLTAAAGSIIPMVRRWDTISEEAKLVVLLGIFTSIIGTAMCGRAGILRERAVGSADGRTPLSSSARKAAGKVFVIGLLWCILSGFLSSCANLGFDFADRVQYEALRLGAIPASATIGRWIPVYWGGFLSILIICGSKMLRKGTWRNYRGPGSARDFGLAALLGCFHFLAQIPYGIGALYLGRLGTTVGWVINISLSLLIGNALGFAIGEWKAAPRRSVYLLFGGLVALIVSMVILAYGNTIANKMS
jgi:L-rhamnose-H+ transport protein